MGTGQVEVMSITMPFRHGGLAQRDVGPVEMDACHMRLLDAPPAAKAMQPVFQFVMMPGQDEEENEEADERAITKLRSTPFVNGNRRQEANCKNCESPAGEPFTEPSAPRIQTVDAPEHPTKTGLSIRIITRFDRWVHRTLTILVV